MIPAIRNTSKPHGERGITLIKNKLSRDILGILFASIGIALFVFGFIRVMADVVIAAYCEKNNIDLVGNIDWANGTWTRNGSLIAALVVFVVIFLFLVGERIDRAVKEIQLQEAALREEREMLIRSLSHDIRTPLTAILSYSEYMQDKQEISQNDMEEYISMMQRKAQQIKVLTNQLLDGGVRKLETIENGRFLMEQLVDEWVTALEDEFPCEVKMECCPDFSGEFDIQELRRVFDNLASNVEKYADAEKPVQLRVYEETGYLVIEQGNYCRKGPLQVESRKIGVESIKKIVGHYNGKVEVKQTEEYYSIKITFFRIL